MEAAGHNPYCVLPQNSFRTDGLANLGVVNQLVYFPELWLRSSTSQELLTILWTNPTMYNWQANVRIPYNEKSGTFTSYTLEGGKHKSKNALWTIKVKYMRNVDETLSVAAPMTTSAPLAAGNTILPPDLFHTDLFGGIGQTRVVFPEFWVQTSGPDKSVISWSGKKQTVRLYNERTGTFKAHTLAIGRTKSENAEWQIKIKFSKFVDNTTGDAAPRPTPSPPKRAPPAPPNRRNTGTTSPDEPGNSEPQELELEPDTGSDHDSEQGTTSEQDDLESQSDIGSDHDEEIPNAEHDDSLYDDLEQEMAD